MDLLQQPYVLVLLFIFGIISQFFSSLPKDIYRTINKFILYVPLPAIVLVKIPFLEITHEVIFPVAAAWIIFVGAIIFAYLVCKMMNYDKKTMACIILCCGLGNTSFVGYPFIKYFYGDQSLQYAIFVDQPGSFLILSTFGVLIANYYSATNFSLKNMVLRLVKFPPFLIFIFAIFIPKNFITGNTFLVLDFFGKLMVPLAILSIGMQFKLSLKEIDWEKLSIGLSYKLILAPLIIYIIYFLVLHQQGEIHTVAVIECAMPPMITASILATEYDLDIDLATALSTLGILFSVPTLLIWKWFLG